MSSSNSQSYRQYAADVRRDAQDTLRAFREERLARRKARASTSDETKPAPQTKASRRKKAQATAKSERRGSFTPSPETLEIVGTAPKSKKPQSPARKRTARVAKSKTQHTSSVQTEIDTQLEKLGSLCAEVETAEADQKSARDALAILTTEASETRKALKGDRGELEKVRLSLSDAKNALESVCADRSAVRADVTALETLAKDLRKSVEKLETSVEQKHAELKSLDADLTKVRDEKSALEREASDLRGQLDCERAEHGSLSAELATLSPRVEAARADHGRLSEAAREAEVELKDIREQLTCDEDKLHRLTTERGATERALVETLASFSRERRKLESIRLQLSQAGEQLAASHDAGGVPLVTEPVASDSSLRAIPDIGEGMIWHLQQAGIEDLVALAAASAKDIRTQLGAIGDIADVEAWIDYAKTNAQAAG